MPRDPKAALELLVIAGDTAEVLPLPKSGAVILGRAPDCDVRIDSHAISRRHARLHLGPPLSIEDLGSANGTFVRDRDASADTARTQPLRRVAGAPQDIAVGERVSLGFVAIVVRSADRPLAGSAELIAEDPALRSVYERAARVAKSPFSALILGETGVGKEILARAIHGSSPRATGPFLAINCAALAPSLLEGELFGHERGAFTGAVQAREGLFEAADGGTVFLDEVGELPLEIQAKLLRVLEDRTVTRVGGRAARKVDIRIVSATNRDLEADVERGAFRRDLFFRLNGISLTIPPLRERPLDIAPLAERFAALAARELGHAKAPLLPPSTLDLLRRYPWPGNVRELRNVMDRAVVLCEGDAISPEDLPTTITSNKAAPASPSRAPEERREEQLHQDLKALEKKKILDALARCSGNQTRAAEELGISLRTLVNRLDEHQIPRPRKR